MVRESNPTTPFKVKALALLDICIEKGACMSYTGDMTPSPPKGSQKTAETMEEYHAKRAQALELCKKCVVRTECAVYSKANGATPINGNSALDYDERVAVDEGMLDLDNFVKQTIERHTDYNDTSQDK